MGYYENHKDLTIFNPGTIDENDLITLVKFNEFGYPNTVHLKMQITYFDKYAQHEDCLYLQGIEKGKRKAVTYVLKPHDLFVIYKGFVNIKDFRTYETWNNHKVTCFGTCFDYEKFKQINTNQYEKIFFNFGA